MDMYFRNVHLANQQLEVEHKKIEPTLHTIKTFSPTRWKGWSVMFRSAWDCRQAIGCLFSNEITKPADQESLLDIADTGSKASSILQMSLNRGFGHTFWSTPTWRKLSLQSSHIWILISILCQWYRYLLPFFSTLALRCSNSNCHHLFNNHWKDDTKQYVRMFIFSPSFLIRWSRRTDTQI